MRSIRIQGRLIQGSEVEAYFGSTKGPGIRLRIGSDKGAAQRRKIKARAKAKAARTARKGQR